MRQRKAEMDATPEAGNGALRYDVFESTWGWVAVCGSSKGIRYATLPASGPHHAAGDLEDAMRRPLPALQPGAFEAYERQLAEYFGGRRASCDVELDLEGASPFFRRAWEACRSIPPGETRSYEWLAAAAGNVRAARGAGQAMARNRVPIVVPCHRVIGKDGGLHGFGGAGLPLKARLLQLEAARKE